MKCNYFWAAFCSVACTLHSYGRQLSLSGSELELWTEQHHCVVLTTIQRIKTIHVQEKGYDYYTANLTLKAMLGGSIDPSVTQCVPVRFVANMAGSSNHCVPQEGAIVLAFISIGWPRDHENWIEEAVIGFMPGEGAWGQTLLAAQLFRSPACL